jgi:hypothetical protein
LDHDQWNAFMSHLDRVRMPELMRREPSPDTGCGRGVVQLLSCR